MFILLHLSLALALGEGGRAALQVGDCAAALADRAGAADDAERIALARCELRAGQTEAALARLAPTHGGPLGAYGDLVAGEALLAAGRPAQAAARLATVTLPREAGQRVQMLRGRALVESGDTVGGRAVLAGALQGPLAEPAFVPTASGADPAELRWWLAEAAVRRGESAKAVPVWQALWSRNPASPRASEAASRLATAGQPVPDTRSEEGRRLVRARIKSLDKLRRYDESLLLRDQLGRDGAPEPKRTLAWACFNAKDYARAAELFAVVPSPTPVERFNLALATSRAGDYAGAAALYVRIYTELPTTPQGDLASYKVGWLAYDKGEVDRALGLFRDHLARFPASKHADEARWFIGWTLYRQDKLAEARLAMEALVRQHPGSPMVPAARYWMSRIDGRQGDAAAEKKGLEALSRDTPTSSYAWFAAGRLGRVWSPPRPAPPLPDASSPGSAALERGRALARAGLDGWAREELRDEKPTQKADVLRLGELLVLAGDYTGAQALGRPWCGSAARRDGDPAARALCWPRPAAAALDARTAEAGLDRNLPYGIMNAESALKPGVTSGVGARGLMQMMPAVAARRHAAIYPGSPFDADALYQPAYNALLGTTELITLAEHLRGKGLSNPLPAVIAAYNAGPEPVERWLSGYAAVPDPDRFAEDISFNETRQYVRNVLGYLQTWRLVYGD